MGSRGPKTIAVSMKLSVVTLTFTDTVYRTFRKCVVYACYMRGTCVVHALLRALLMHM